MLTAAPFTILDVSDAQGTIDWAKVAAPGRSIPGVRVDGCFAKASEGAAGPGSASRTFAANAAGALAAGLDLGAYHFLSAFSTAADQAAHFIGVVRDCGATLSPMVDVERGVGTSAPFPSVECLLEFLAIVQQELDVIPLIYTSGWVAAPMRLQDHPELRQHPLWVANYNLSDPVAFAPWGRWDDPAGGVLAWQWTSSARVPGINTAVDMSRFKSMPAWAPATTERTPAPPSG